MLVDSTRGNPARFRDRGHRGAREPLFREKARRRYQDSLARRLRSFLASARNRVLFTWRFQPPDLRRYAPAGVALPGRSSWFNSHGFNGLMMTHFQLTSKR